LSDHLTQNQIEGYGRRPLPAAEWLFVSDHLSVCEACRRRVEESVDGEATYLALKSGVFDETGPRLSSAERAHLSFDQMSGFADDAIAGEELQAVKDHLAWCEECETAVDDLRSFKDRVAPELERENRMSPRTAATEGRQPRLTVSKPFLRRKSPASVVVSALVILLLAAVGWSAWQATQKRKDMPQVAVTTPAPDVSPTVIPAPPPKGEAAVIARLNDGASQVTLDQEGRLSGVDHLPPAYQQMINRALTEQRIERSPLLAELTPRGITPRGDGGDRRNAFSVIEPVGAVTLSDHPTFRWSPLDGATGYVVEVYDEQFDLVATGPQVNDRSWTASQSLKRGGIYSWQVRAVRDRLEFKSPSRGAPQAKFRILDEARADEISKARRAYASSHLTLGLLYAQAGLLDEADMEFRALLKANPDSALAHRLLRQVRVNHSN
jgi:anti-sigma factor RsiW